MKKKIRQAVPTQAHAAVFAKAGKPLEIRAYPLTPPAGTTVLLKLELSGICGTDIHILEGRLPIPPAFIPGHEFIGHIVAMGPRARRDGLGSPLKPGDLAIACVAKPCGACFNCRQGETASCLNFGVTNIRNPDEAPHLFGGFAEMLYQQACYLVKVPPTLDLDAVAAFPCAGPTAIRAFDFAGNLRKGELVVVQGTGPVGLFAIAWAARAGCTVVAIGSGSQPARMRLARRLGADHVLDYRKVPEADRLAFVNKLAARLNRGNGADVVFEASGSPAAIPEGMNLCRTLGRYIVPGQYSASGTVAIHPELITFRALKIIGSGQYKLADIATYLKFLGRHRDLQREFARCITHRYPVRDAVNAIRNASSGQSVKGVFIA